MLASKDLGGKYGIRVAGSERYASLGTSSVGFLMYPQAETAGGRLDSLSPDIFRYEITARALDPA